MFMVRHIYALNVIADVGDWNWNDEISYRNKDIILVMVMFGCMGNIKSICNKVIKNEQTKFQKTFKTKNNVQYSV